MEQTPEAIFKKILVGVVALGEKEDSHIDACQPVALRTLREIEMGR
jgi:hypothetical protein